jgi:hypothetical protein
MKSSTKIGTKPKNRLRPHLLRLLTFFTVTYFLATSIALAATANGFITKIDSATTFDVGTLHVVLNAHSRCDKQGLLLLAEKTIIPLFAKNIFIPCDTRTLTVGSYMHLTGVVVPDKHKFVVAQATVYITHGTRTLEGGALLQESPELRQVSQGMGASWWIDGYPTTVTPKTKLFSEPSTTFFRYWNMGGFHVHAKILGTSTRDSFSASLLKQNTWITYNDARAADGTIIANQIRFWPNQVDAAGEKFLRMFAAKITAPNYKKYIPGSIQYKHGNPIQILPDQSVQDYVSHLGMELVPQYQKELASNDPTKVYFRFYVVHSFVDTQGNHLVETDGSPPKFGFTLANHFTYNSPKRDTLVEGVIAMPNGTVLIPDVALARLNNKAQTAALLSYAITSIVQRQAYTAWPNITSPHARRFGESFSFIYNFGFWQSRQVLRIGIRQMYLAGYDIREAPFAWAVAQGKPVNNPVINSKHPDKDIPWYAAYAFNYISHYYKDVDYSKLKRGEREYQQFLKELYKADPSLPQPKAAATK